MSVLQRSGKISMSVAGCVCIVCFQSVYYCARVSVKYLVVEEQLHDYCSQGNRGAEKVRRLNRHLYPPSHHTHTHWAMCWRIFFFLSSSNSLLLFLPVFLSLVSSPSSPQQQPGQLRNGSWKGSNYSFARHTWLLLASTHYYLSGILQCGARPTIHCNPLHLCQPRCFFSLSGCLHWWGPDCIAWQSEAQWWAEKHKIMGGLLREALLREKIFSISLPPPTQPTFHLFYLRPPAFSISPPSFMALIIFPPQWWSPAATCKWKTLLWV